MAQTEKEVLACVPLGWKGSEMQLQPPNPAPHAHSPPALPSAELSPPAVRLYSLGILVPGQGGPGQLQRQEGPGLRPPQPARTPISPQQAHRQPCLLVPSCLLSISISAFSQDICSEHFAFRPCAPKAEK